MKRFKIFILSLLFFSVAYPQSGGFDLNQYINFLSSHQNMTPQDLYQLYPAGTFLGNINKDYQSVLYFDSIDIKYNLTDYEKSLIHDHGFMVTQRLSKGSIGQVLLDIHHKDLPVFVSTDAILYAFHVSYDRILRDVELGLLISDVGNLLSSLRSKMTELDSKYGSISQMDQKLKDVDVYLTVALNLMGSNTSPFYPENSGKIDTLLNLIMNAEGISEFNLFSDHCVTYDWSQFKPRGHYDSNMHPELAKYFRTMMWLGRIEIYLSKPNTLSGNCGMQSFADIQRQIIDAYLIDELFQMANVHDQYEEIENILEYFVGKQDNVTLPNLEYLKNAVQIDSASQFLDSSRVVTFQDTLKNQSFAYQLILSQLLNGDPMTPDSIVPASSFLLFGQRFVIDSYVTSSVVYDRIKYLGQDVCRLFPSTLDPNFALGNSSAAQLLEDELNQFHYSTNLAALRYLIDSYTPDYWQSSLYNFWLNAIRELNTPEDRTNLPDFMQTAAFWQEKINTQLSSWTELRHDNLLYAKQSYTGIPICSFPYSYVEPFPEFYNVLKNTGSSAKLFFQSLNITDDNIKQNILDYFTHLENVSDTLGIISQKELNNEQLNSDETDFLQNMLFYMPTYFEDTIYSGWYPELLYRDREFENKGFLGENYLVADYHTTPADCGGTMHGWVSHAGTGPFDVGVVTAKISGTNEECAFIGPVLSYREYVTTNFLRLTDDEWKNSYLYLSSRPDFVNLYLADSSGQSRGSGRELVTDVKNQYIENIPVSNLVVKNYPNPFNPSTIISFTIPSDLSNKNAELVIYDIQGKVVKHLINNRFPSGTYLTKWYGKNDAGMQVASGIYIYRLKIANRQAVGKMNLIK